MLKLFSLYFAMRPMLFGVINVIVASTMVHFIRIYAIKGRLVDVPNHRSSHQRITPRAGGLAIVLCFLTSCQLLLQAGVLPKSLWLALSLGGLPIAFIGLLDDVDHIPASLRLFIHTAASVWAIFLIGDLPMVHFGFYQCSWGIFGYLVTLFGMVWLINLYNFMDGIDGLSGAEGLFLCTSAALILFLHQEAHMASLFIIFGCAILGFLFWNWSPAKIFLGDIGSGFLGFIFAVLFLFTARNTVIGIWPWLILMGIYIIDATVTLLTRIFTGQRWYEAHCTHAFQQLNKLWQNHRKVTLFLSAINVVCLLPLAILSSYYTKWGFLLTLTAWTPLVMGAIYLCAGRE